MTTDIVRTDASLTVLGAGQANNLLYMFSKDPAWNLTEHQWDPQRCIPDTAPPTCPTCGAHDIADNCYVEEWDGDGAEAYIARYTCGQHVWARLTVFTT